MSIYKPQSEMSIWNHNPKCLFETIIRNVYLQTTIRNVYLQTILPNDFSTAISDTVYTVYRNNCATQKRIGKFARQHQWNIKLSMYSQKVVPKLPRTENEAQISRNAKHVLHFRSVLRHSKYYFALSQIHTTKNNTSGRWPNACRTRKQ